jgi:hypothetical protein
MYFRHSAAIGRGNPGLNSMLTTGDQNIRQDGMGSCATSSAVAATGPPRDHCWAQHTLRQFVGGFQVVNIERTKQVSTMFAQTVSKAVIIAIGQPALGRNQSIQARFQAINILIETRVGAPDVTPVERV